MTDQLGPVSLFGLNAEEGPGGSDPRPYPGTLETAQIETIDNDRAVLLLDAGVVR